MSVTPSVFEKQMQWIADRGYTTVSMDTLAAMLKGELAGPTKPVVITFDDNNRTAYDVAFPVLVRHGYVGVYYLVTNRLDNKGFIPRDLVLKMVAAGMDRASAILKAGRTRLRPILMTTGALVAGMLPVAVGLNEASSMRSSMGIAVIGGLLSSTLLSLIVVPAAYSYVDRFRLWSGKLVARLVGYKGTGEERKGARVEHKVDAPRMDS